MTAPGEAHREALRRAGITPDKPLHAVLTVAFEAAQSAKAVAAGARGLSPEGERDLIDRLGREGKGAMDRMARDAWRERRWIAALGVAAVALGGLGVGYLIGQRSHEDEVRFVEQSFGLPLHSATGWLEIAKRNRDPQAATVRTYSLNGGKVAEMRVWLEWPPVPAPNDRR